MTAARAGGFAAVMLLVACALPGHAYARPVRDDAAAARAVRAVEERRVQALTHGDLATLDELLTDDLVYTHSNGRVQTKAELLAGLRAGEIAYDAVEHGDVRVAVYGDAAVMTGRSRLRVRANGQAITLPVRFTLVYVRRGGRWRMAVWQSTAVPAQ